MCNIPSSTPRRSDEVAQWNAEREQLVNMIIEAMENWHGKHSPDYRELHVLDMHKDTPERIRAIDELRAMLLNLPGIK